MLPSNAASKFSMAFLIVLFGIRYSVFNFEYLYGEDWYFATGTQAFDGSFQQFLYDHAAFGRSVCSIIDGTEYDLISPRECMVFRLWMNPSIA